jgi:MFS family permease
MLGLGLGGALYDLADSWRVPYLIMLPPTLLVVVVMAVVIKGVPSAPKTQGGFKYLLQNRNMLALGFTSFSALYAYMVISTWGPSFLVEQRGYTLTRAGLYISLVAACSVAGALVWGRLSDRIGRKRLTLAMLTVSAVMVSVATVPQSTAALLASLAAFGFFSSLAWNPIFVAWVGDHTFASGRIGMGTVMGIMNSVGISAAFVAPVVSGWISDTSGSISWAFYVATFVQLAGVVAAVTVKEAGPVRRRAHIAQRSRRADDR